MMIAPLVASVLQNFVHTRSHLGTSPHGIEAVMIIPHVADNDRRLIRIPGFRSRYGVKPTAIFASVSTPAAKLEASETRLSAASAVPLRLAQTSR